MSNLIDAEKLDLVSYQGIPDGYKDSFDSGVLYAMNLIDEQPTIDAVPVVHGHWNHTFGGFVGCSNCGDAPLLDGEREYVETEYCPHCGAKMDELTE